MLFILRRHFCLCESESTGQREGWEQRIRDFWDKSLKQLRDKGVLDHSLVCGRSCDSLWEFGSWMHHFLVTDYEAYIEACHTVVENKIPGIDGITDFKRAKNLKRQARGVTVSTLVWVNTWVGQGRTRIPVLRKREDRKWRTVTRRPDRGSIPTTHVNTRRQGLWVMRMKKDGTVRLKGGGWVH